MTDLPRLAVTREQAADLLTDDPVSRLMDGTVVLRVPERPTMPCGVAPDQACEHEGVIPIPDGVRVEVGGWEYPGTGEPRVWHPVATATVTEVTEDHANWPSHYRRGWHVALSDVEPLEVRP